VSEKQSKEETPTTLDEAAYAKDTKLRNRSLRDLLDKKIAFHQDETNRLIALRDRTPGQVLDMVVRDLSDILRM
jgi:hypothetical protein